MKKPKKVREKGKNVPKKKKRRSLEKKDNRKSPSGIMGDLSILGR